MLQKFLLIGLGGSGGKALRYTWRELDRRLRAAEWEEGVPAGWQFLHIDVPQYPDVVEGDVPPTIGDSARYVGLARQPFQYTQYDDQLVANPELLPAIAGWRPDPRVDYSNIYKGAGQRRVVGRVVTLTQLEKVGGAIDSAVTALSTTEIDEQMRRLDRCLGTSGDTRHADAATAVVIASLGGGAGSGAFLDVIELLKRRATDQAQWLDNSLVTILFAADVFSSLTPDQRTGIEPNTLAALSELLSATEHEGPVPDLEDRLLDLGGGTIPIRNRRTGRHNFIIGAKNSSVKFETSLDVFRSVGKAMATFMADERVNRQFETYIETNADGKEVSEAFAISSGGRCSSFGYASVSLGRALFGQYATERLAKRTLDRLLRGHREGVADAHLRRDEALIAERVEMAQASFFEASGLWELGTEHNQVLEALRDRAELGKQLEQLVQSVQAKLRGLSKRSPKEWLESLTSNFDDQAIDFEGWAHSRMNERSQRWVTEAQERLLSATARYAGMYGLPVTLGLLDSLAQQALDAASELGRDANGFKKEESDSISSLQHLFATIRDKVLGPNHSAMEPGLKYRRRALQRRFEADACEFTAKLLREISTGLVPPLRSALGNASSSLATAEKGEFREIVDRWSASGVPAHLLAAPNELLLEKQEDYSAQLGTLLDALVEGAGSDAGESSALAEIVSGAWPSIYQGDSSPGHQTLVIQSAQWAPTLTAARPASTPPRPGSFKVEFTPQDVAARAARWIRDRRGPLSQHVRGTLAGWLDSGQPDAPERAERFASMFDLALASAAPLVSVNAEIHQLVHGDPPSPPALIISDIPIDAGHRAYRRIVESLSSAGLEPGVIKGVFNPNVGSTSVEVTSFAARYVHPVVFDSLTVPIQRDWQTRTDQPRRGQFWHFRRARPLTSFIPVSPARQEAMVRGWLTATVLGQVGLLQGRWSDAPLKIWTPRGSRRFPQFLLGRDVTSHGSVLPALLESLPLALLTYANKEPDELEAYMRLLELGSPPGGVGSGYHEANEELAGWVVQGAKTQPQPGFEEAPAPPHDYAGSAESGIEERSDALILALTTYEANYRSSIGDQPITRETSLTVGPGWEIRELVSRAAMGLVEAVKDIPHVEMPKTAGGLGVPER